MGGSRTGMLMARHGWESSSTSTFAPVILTMVASPLFEMVLRFRPSPSHLRAAWRSLDWWLIRFHHMARPYNEVILVLKPISCMSPVESVLCIFLSYIILRPGSLLYCLATNGKTLIHITPALRSVLNFCCTFEVKFCVYSCYR